MHKFFCQAVHIWRLLIGKQALVQENEALKKQCHYYSYLLQEQRSDGEALKQLLPFFSLKEDTHFEYLYAHVLRREIQWWWNTYWIDKGSAEGVTKGLGVICPHGVVGKIHRVFRHSSIIELITSPHFRSVVHVGKDMRPILYEGQASLPWSLTLPQGKLSQVPIDFHEAAIDGVKVVSSDLSGVFPEGIVYGTALSSRTGPKQKPSVILFPEIQSLKEVILLIPRHKVEKEENFGHSSISD
ncbi:MAG: rod shape-determining protein MreC [Puniceicoccales bacterium]|nr:rod shape-determining protein MreC [Puniceicoccales bacterium]